MNKTTMTARVSDQHLLLVNEPLLASGGVDEVKIRFDFCTLWDGCGKTAVFYRNPEAVYHVAIVDGWAMVPNEVLADEGYFYLGVMGSANNIRTTEVVRVKVSRGALTEATKEPAEPTPDIYQQLLAAYGGVERDLKKHRVQMQELNGGGLVTLWVGTTAEYEALGAPEPNRLYIITDDTTGEDIKKAAGIESEEHPGCYYRMIDGNEHWINPPMIPWKNYLTTEKFDGKYVYVVTSDYSMEETSGTETFALTNSLLGSTNAQIVSVEGALVDTVNHFAYPLNNYDKNGGYSYVTVAGKRVEVTHTSQYGLMSVRLKVKYVVG